MRPQTISGSLRAHQVIGVALIFLLLAGAGGWAAVASIHGAVIAQAKVVVET